MIFASIRFAAAALLGAITLHAEDVLFTPQKLQEFGAKYCYDCHGEKKQKGDFNFEPFAKKPDVMADRKMWETIAELIETREMPPEKKPQPSEADRHAIVQWIDAQLNAGETGKKNPGRVTLRRLNHTEYRNTIRDLLAVDFNPEDFPQDDTAYGFDTIAEALSIPPLLMEKYLAAAEEIATRALANDRQGPPSKTVRGSSFKGTDELVRPVDNNILGLFREGSGVTDVQFNGDGEYRLRIMAFGEQAGPEAPKLAVSIDDQVIHTFEVPAKGKPAPYEVKTTVKGGNRKLSVTFLNNYNEVNHPDPKMRGDRNAYVASVEITGPLHIEQEPPESYRRIITRKPEPGTEKVAAREMLRSFASKAFRRPATDAEVERLGKLADLALDQNAPFPEAMGVGVTAVLSSPAFLFRWELDPEAVAPGGIRPLNAHEVASRLSYFLWSSMPDAELSALADSGALLKDGNLEKQVRRMIADWRSQALVRNFSAQWLQIRAIDEIDVDDKKFPKFNWQLREAMKEESRLFFDAILREDRSIHELVDADFTYVNQRLADLYGIPGVQGDKFQRIQLPPDSPRGGVLGQAAVLLATSMPTRTSPVIRGKWVLDQLLGTPAPPAPANVPPLEDVKIDKNAPLRVRLEQHRNNADCAVCHDKIDPVGFALENFDAIGAWRTHEGKNPIDTSGVLPGGIAIKGVDDLKNYLQGEKFTRNFASKLFTYALGRGIERYDKPAIDRLVAETNANGLKISSLIVAIVTSDPFLQRKRDVAANR